MPVLLDTLYACAAIVASPYVLARMATSERWRAGQRERLGSVPPREGDARCIWLHCASVGEALNVRSFLDQLRERLPDWEVVVSVNTNTGMAVVEKRYPDLKAFYYPMDLTCTVRRSLRRIRPDCVVLFELEAWPSFMTEAAKQDIPIVVINGRINPKTVTAHRALRWVAGDFWRAGVHNAYGVQNGTYAERFKELGVDADKIQITGNVKYDNIDLEGDAEAKEHIRSLFQIEPQDAIIVGGSTWDGEEKVLLDAFAALRSEVDNLRLILVPRHIERADAVSNVIEKAGYSAVRKTALDAGEDPPCPLRDAVILVDTVGDLATVFALATVAFVGKSLVPLGGQNMLEPAGLARPVVFGPHTSNFERESRLLLDKQAAICVNNGLELTDTLRELLASPQQAAEMGQRAQQVIVENTGAAQRSVDMVVDVLTRKDLLK